jgi:hypothetical protein
MVAMMTYSVRTVDIAGVLILMESRSWGREGKADQFVLQQVKIIIAKDILILVFFSLHPVDPFRICKLPLCSLIIN